MQAVLSTACDQNSAFERAVFLSLSKLFLFLFFVITCYRNVGGVVVYGVMSFRRCVTNKLFLPMITYIKWEINGSIYPV